MPGRRLPPERARPQHHVATQHSGAAGERGSEPDLPSLRRRAVTLRERLNEHARLHARGVIDAQQLAAGSGELRTALTAVESRLASGIRREPPGGIAGRLR